jgi:hypothetical protein
MGLDAFLPKPIRWPRLAVVLEECLGLQWEYESARERVGKEEQVVLVPPPKEELTILLDLARQGDMRAIQERAAHIETLGEQYVPFADKLHRLAKGFEERDILAMIRGYLNVQGD